MADNGIPAADTMIMFSNFWRGKTIDGGA